MATMVAKASVIELAQALLVKKTSKSQVGRRFAQLAHDLKTTSDTYQQTSMIPRIPQVPAISAQYDNALAEIMKSASLSPSVLTIPLKTTLSLANATYGETSPESMQTLLQGLAAVHNNKTQHFPDRFINVGSGNGVATVCAALGDGRFPHSSRIEYEENRTTLENNLKENNDKQRHTSNLDFTCDDLANESLSAASAVFSNSVCFDAALCATVDCRLEEADTTPNAVVDDADLLHSSEIVTEPLNDDDLLLYDSKFSIFTDMESPVRQKVKAPPSSTSMQLEEHTLNGKQAEAFDLIRDGSNVFITGVAGTGKSLILKRVIHYLQQEYDPHEFVAVGPTGPTAIALEGQTIHSFAGIGIPKTQDDFRKTIKNKKRWKDLKVIILDEASMVSGEFFDCLSDVVSTIRSDWRPFGGIQLVVCGDFLQLPPIPPRKSDVAQIMIAALDQEQPGKNDPNDFLFLNRGFLFQAKTWKQADFKVVELEQVFRQKNKDFVKVLEEIRRGRLTPTGLDFLKTHCQRPLPINDFGIRPTILHSMNKDVSRENAQELNQLTGETHVYASADTVQREQGAAKWAENQLLNNQFFTNCVAEKELNLKVGAQVMLVKNEGRGGGAVRKLVNGSRGKVVGFEKIKTTPANADNDPLLPGVTLYPVVQFVSGVKKTIRPTTFESKLIGLGTCTRVAIPLRLAWAITTHKSQGLTLDYVIADVGNVFAEAQTYVALSRASDENGLELRNFSTSRVRANKMALAFYENPGQAFCYWDGSEPINNNGGSSQIQEDPSAPESVRQLTANKPANRQASFRSIQEKTFVFCGILTSMPRDQAESLVEQHRGVVRGSVSGKTNFLVLGEKMKNGKASILGANFLKAKTIIEGNKNVSNLQVLTEKEFFQLIKEKDGS